MCVIGLVDGLIVFGGCFLIVFGLLVVIWWWFGCGVFFVVISRKDLFEIFV